MSVGMTDGLYNHQKEAFDFFKDMKEIALFFEPGVGKSATTLRIASYKFKKGDINALLIIAPNQVHSNVWAKDQIPKWLNCGYTLQCLYGEGGVKKAYLDCKLYPHSLQVVCVNIDTFSTPEKWKEIAEWSNANRTFIVLDECTVIKNLQSLRTQRILYEFNDVVRRRKTIISSVPKSVARAILTGTPVTNGTLDLWTLFEFLRPNYFGRNYYSFRSHFGMFTRLSINDRSIDVPLSEDWWKAIKSIQTFGEANALCGCSEDTFNTVHAQDHYEGPYKHADELKELIKPVSMFKALKDCVDMPDQVYIRKKLLMTPEQSECYTDMVTELIATYNDAVATAKNKLTALLRLQQITSGFICDKQMLVDDTAEESVIDRLYKLSETEDIMPDEVQWIGASNPKLDMLYRDVDESPKPVIIITRFTAEADRIYNDLSKKHNCCLITGWKRVGTIEEFQEGKYNVMVANSSVIARGFNLQNSHNMLFYSNTFSLEIRLQAEGRIFRIGQNNKCEYVDYVYIDTVDEKVIEALRMKRNLLDFIRDTDIKEVVK